MADQKKLVSETRLARLLARDKVHHNLSHQELLDHALRRGEGRLSANGTLMVDTGIFTGRSPRDRYFVEESGSRDHLWWGEVNRPVSDEVFETLLELVLDHLAEQELFVFEGYAGADRSSSLPVRVISERAWQAHFARNMFRQSDREEGQGIFATSSTPSTPSTFTILSAPGTRDPDHTAHGLHSPVFIIFNLRRRLALIGGTAYGGEIKKGLFSIMNYYLPRRDILTMHCSANLGPEGDVALFFGMSGTGKTTLSTSPGRRLIGDDEHGWSEQGIFNLEGGCYAKCIGLDPDREPEIFKAVRPPAALLENVVFESRTGRVDFHDATKTENTRVSYPLAYLESCQVSGLGGHPRNVIFLTCDSFGVLPPVSRLPPGKAMYYFLSGYTAKVAGTERGVDEPVATFSACFGEPFLTLAPTTYARMMMERLYQHRTAAWLVNTGWTGGPYGVGQRIELAITRRIIKAILGGELRRAPLFRMPVFCLDIPSSVSGVDPALLDPANTWADREAFHRQVDQLARMFIENFQRYKSEGARFDYSAFGPQLEE